MATTTTYLGLTKPVRTEPVSIDPLNNNFDKIDAGVLRAMRGKAADNLLDNGYFSSSQVINQRSATKPTESGYCFDRWIGQNGDIGLSFSADALTMTSKATAKVYIYQKIRTGKGLNGKTLTVAVCDGAGEIATRSVTLPTTNTSTWTNYGNATTSHGVYANIVDKGSGDYPMLVCCGLRSGHTTGTIRWVALYEGAYTADTLPDYVPKGYAAELAECQRYYWAVPSSDQIGYQGYVFNATTARITIPLPTRMRVVPTLSISNRANLAIFSAQGANNSISSVAIGDFSNGMGLSLLVTGTFSVAPCACVLRFNTSVSLSADL